MDAPRTPLKTEIGYLLSVLFVAGGLAVAGAIYFAWRVLAAGAHC